MSAAQGHDDQIPIFKAVSNSARQLFQLLNCIRFVPKVHVTISNEGLRFAVEDARVMQGVSSTPSNRHLLIPLQALSFSTKHSLPPIIAHFQNPTTKKIHHPIYRTSKFPLPPFSKHFRYSVLQTQGIHDSPNPKMMATTAQYEQVVRMHSAIKHLACHLASVASHTLV